MLTKSFSTQTKNLLSYQLRFIAFNRGTGYERPIVSAEPYRKLEPFLDPKQDPFF